MLCDALLQVYCQSMLIGKFSLGFFYNQRHCRCVQDPSGLANENTNVLAGSLNLVMSTTINLQECKIILPMEFLCKYPPR